MKVAIARENIRKHRMEIRLWLKELKKLEASTNNKKEKAMKPNRIACIVVIFAVLFLSGCAGRQLSDMTTEEKAFKTLSTSLSLYNLTMESVSDMQLDGFISTETRARINDIAGKYRLAHLAASRALYAYKSVADAQNEQRLLVAIDEASRAFTDFIEFVEPILKERAK